MNYKYYTAAGLIVLAFAGGRYLTPTKIETKTVEVEHKETEAEREKHKDTTTVTTEKPDGTRVTETHTVEDTNARRSTDSTTDKQSDTVKTYAGVRTSITALAGLGSLSGPPIYGGAVSRSILGPVNAGAWALTNGTVGVSLGLEF